MSEANDVVLTVRISLPDEVRPEESRCPETAESCEEPTQARQRQRRLDPDQVSKLVAHYHTGKAINQLATDWKVNRTTVMAHLRRQGVPKRNSRKMNDRQVAEAAALYRSGCSLAKLGRKFGVDAETVRKELQGIGVQMRPRT